MVIETRPKLPQDTIYLPSEGGIVFRRAGRTLALKGSEIFELVSAFTPYLRGQTTVEQLTAELPESKAAAMQKLIATLIREDMLIDHSIEDEQRLSAAERSAFAAQIDFLEHLMANPCGQLKLLRDAHIFVTGAGLPLAALVTSLLRNGVRRVSKDSDVSLAPWTDSLMHTVEEVRMSGVDCELREESLASILSHSGDSLGGSSSDSSIDAICYVAAEANMETLLRINAWCRQREVVFFQGCCWAALRAWDRL